MDNADPVKISRTPLAGIVCSNRLRGVNEEAVAGIMESMSRRGLINPIWVNVAARDQYGIATSWRLIVGLHRVEAAKRLGWTEIDSRIVADMSEVECQLMEISENLHRAELTAGERREQLAEWIRLTEAKVVSSQVGTKPGRPESGVNAAAREIGVTKSEAHRAVKIMEKVTPDAVEAAKVAGIWDNTSAMEKVATYADDDQVEAVADIVAEKAKPKAKPEPIASPEPVTVVQIGEPEFQHNNPDTEVDDISEFDPNLRKAVAYLRRYVESLEPSLGSKRWLESYDEYHLEDLGERVGLWLEMEEEGEAEDALREGYDGPLSRAEAEEIIAKYAPVAVEPKVVADPAVEVPAEPEKEPEDDFVDKLIKAINEIPVDQLPPDSIRARAAGQKCPIDSCEGGTLFETVDGVRHDLGPCGMCHPEAHEEPATEPTVLKPKSKSKLNPHGAVIRPDLAAEAAKMGLPVSDKAAA